MILGRKVFWTLSLKKDGSEKTFADIYAVVPSFFSACDRHRWTKGKSKLLKAM